MPYDNIYSYFFGFLDFYLAPYYPGITVVLFYLDYILIVLLFLIWIYKNNKM